MPSEMPRMPRSLPKSVRQTFSRAFAAVGLAVAALAPMAAAAEPIASDWQPAHAAKARLLVAGGTSGQPLTAAVEIALDDGWKTYWRFPGDAGGVPPAFDWAGTTNATPQVLFPAPKRISDRAGDTVGYKGDVLLPVRLGAVDPKQPTGLRLKLEYGICKEICVPAEATLALDLPAGFGAEIPPSLVAALAHVPGPASERTPSVVSHDFVLSGDTPKLAFEARYPGGGSHADAFVEASGGAAVALPRKDGPMHDGRQRFVIDLSRDEAADVKGKTLTVTLVSEAGQSETSFNVP